jgi:iron complex outermembrane receptor protein
MHPSFQPKGRAGRRLAALSTIPLFALTLIASAQALAQGTSGSVESTQIELDIATQPLGRALNALARQTGLQLLVQPDLVAGRTAPALRGRYTPRDALDRLLDGSGLEASIRDGAVVIRRAGSSSSAVTELEAVRVDADAYSGSAGRGYRARSAGVATFGEQSILDTPFQVNVITSDVMRAQEARSLSDVARNDPSLTISGSTQGFFDAVAVRGFELNNWSGYRRDGLMYPNQYQVPLENKEAVEIVKGLSALRYGFTNPGGVINFVVKKPTENDLRTLRLFGNEFGGVGAHADFGGRFGERREFGYRINAVVEEEQSFVRHVEGPRRMLSGYFDWRVTPALLAEFELEYQERDLVQGLNIGLASFAPGVTPFVPTAVGPRTFLGQKWGVYPTTTTTYGARLSYALTDAWTLRTAVQYTNAERDQVAASIRAGSLQANGDFLVSTFYNPGQYRRPVVTETVLEGKFETAGLRHDLTAGFATMDHRIGFGPSLSPVLGTSNIYDPLDVPEPSFASLPPSIEAIRQRERAVFIADTVRFNDQWQVFVGLRHTRPDYRNYNTTTGALTSSYDRSATTTSAGIVYKPTPASTIYASYAEGIEQGGTAPITATNANAVLTPLESTQYEIGYKAEVLEGLTLSSALFRIEKGLELVDNTNTFVQDGRQVHTGVEFTASGALTRQLSAVAGLMLLDAEVERAANATINGNEPVNAPRRQANLFLTYRPTALPGAAFSGGLFHTGPRAVDAANTLYLPAHTRIDVGASYTTRIEGRPTTFSAYLENLTDRAYFSSVSFSQFSFGAPRMLRLSATVAF